MPVIFWAVKGFLRESVISEQKSPLLVSRFQWIYPRRRNSLDIDGVNLLTVLPSVGPVRGRQAVNQRAELEQILDPKMRPARRDDHEGILCCQIRPLHRDALCAAVIAGEVDAIACRASNPAFDKVELTTEEGMVGVGYPEALAGAGRSFR